MSRLRGAHRAPERQGRRLRVLQTLPSRRHRAGMDTGTGSRSNARMASALRRCAVLVRLVGHARTSARRRSTQTTTCRRMARAVHCHRSVRELGGGRRATPSPAPERSGVNAVDIRTRRLRLAVCERERLRSPRRFCHCVCRGGATPRARGRLSAAVRRTEAQIPGRRRSRPRRERDYRNQWASHREHRAPPDARPVAKELASSATGRDHSSRHQHQRPTAAPRLKQQSVDRFAGGCFCGRAGTR